MTTSTPAPPSDGSNAAPTAEQGPGVTAEAASAEAVTSDVGTSDVGTADVGTSDVGTLLMSATRTATPRRRPSPGATTPPSGANL